MCSFEYLSGPYVTNTETFHGPVILPYIWKTI